MKLYSDFGGRRALQITADIVAILLIAGWTLLGVTIFRLVSAFGDFGRQMEDAGAGFRSTMVDLGDSLGGIPLIGGGVRVPFDGASEAGGALESAGQGQQSIVTQLATTLGIATAGLPIAVILLIWLLPRLRFARRSSQAAALMKSAGGIDLLALRALVTLPVSVVAGVGPNAIESWRQGDEQVTRSLARLELRRGGVRL